MANLLYDEAGVQNTIICLNNASSMLDGTSGAINSAISTINNAKNIHWLGGLDFSFALNAVAEGQSSIDENITELRNRSSYILNYSNDGNSGNTFSEIADFAARMGERFVEFNKKALEATGAVVGLGISLFGDSLSDLGDLLNKIGDKISGKDVGCKVGSAASILDERLKKIREEEERRRQLEEEERHRIEEGISGRGSGIGNDHIDAMRDRQLEEERRRIEEQQRMEEEQRRIAEEQARGQGKMPGVATVIPGGGSSSGDMDIGIKNGNSAVGRASGIGAATGGAASAAGGMDIGIKMEIAQSEEHLELEQQLVE